jgi:hypothetical protein
VSALKTPANIAACIRMIRRWRPSRSSTSFPEFTAVYNDLDNLALSCIDCNLHKGTNLAGIDPQTDELTGLFYPRRQEWKDHFEWQGIYLAGKTTTGRATIRVLRINAEDQVALRSS